MEWKFIFIWGSILLSLRITHQAANVALGGVAALSSLLDPLLLPNLVIDGKPYSDYYGYQSCVSTLWEDNPWWRVDMRGPYDIISVEVIRRSDCCSSYLNGAEIRIGNSLENNGNNNPRCVVITVSDYIIMTYNCNQMRGRYVNIFLPGVKRVLQLCEVKVHAATVTGASPANVALGGVAALSSLLDPLLLPNLVIDDKPYSDYNGYRSCVSTPWEDNPWWRVDMRGPYDIISVEVIRRTDCCGSYLNGAEIRIGNSLENNGNNNPRCAVITVTSNIIMTFNCSQMRGRYVNIFLPGVNRQLQLCEVKVYPATVTGANVALGGVAALSSLLDPLFLPHLVIDGKPYSNYFWCQSCVSTLWEDNPWWRVDMRGPYDIISVEVIGRSDCCGSQLNGAEIRIGNSLENSGNNNPRCAVITVTSNIIMTFNCNQMRGRYVNIFLPGVKRILQLCEVKVYATTHVTGVKLAQRGTATQAAAPASNATAPRKAVDKYPGPKQSRVTCASVPVRNNPWWRLDLMSIYRITAVSIISIGDCCSEELNGAEIRIGLRSDTSNHRCAIISIAEGQRNYNYHCGTMEGRFVHVVLPGLQKTLTVCEVQVFGTLLENVALRGVAFQSSSIWKTGNEASRVIDGRRLSTCSRTQNKPGQWVTVDLLVHYNVTAVQLAYSQDCCYGADVRVDNTSCGVIPSGLKSLVTLDCGGTVGRYVTVFHPVIPPPLCEVEVYSTWINLQNKVPQLPPRHDFKKKKKRSVFRISADFDMSDPVIQQQILSQLEAKMKNKGISDFKIRWRMSGRLSHKEETARFIPPEGGEQCVLEYKQEK